MADSRPGPTQRVRVREWNDGAGRDRSDYVVTEEPLELRLSWPGREARSLVVTMRTPGNDFELAAGFLFTEGILQGPDHLRGIRYCVDVDEQRYNVVTVDLTAPPEDPPTRYGGISSACGVCGKQTLDDLRIRGSSPAGPGPEVDTDLIAELPDRLLEAQRVFGRTGGLHAAGLFDAAGEVLAVREDVGRHNAVDKVVGWSLLQGREADDCVLVVSGRAGFEICQKAVAAGIPFIVAVGAPSSLAVDVAREFGVTLAGFARRNRCVVYSGSERVLAPSSRTTSAPGTSA